VTGRARTAAVLVAVVTLVAVGARRLPTDGLPVWLARIVGAEDVPAEYAGKTNPHRGDHDAVRAGAALFRENCAMCHGSDADGRGPASVGLVPPPANFRGSDVLARHSDAYLFFRLSEGKPGTAMPSFHGALGESERWSLVAYLRSIAGEHASAPGGSHVVSSAAR
jgi:mono/diheme cytochrome c family protein